MTNVEKIKFANLILKSTILVLVNITFQNEVTKTNYRHGGKCLLGRVQHLAVP